MTMYVVYETGPEVYEAKEIYFNNARLAIEGAIKDHERTGLDYFVIKEDLDEWHFEEDFYALDDESDDFGVIFRTSDM